MQLTVCSVSVIGMIGSIGFPPMVQDFVTCNSGFRPDDASMVYELDLSGDLNVRPHTFWYVGSHTRVPPEAVPAEHHSDGGE